MEQEINILDYYNVIKKRKELIISFTAASVIITAIFCLFMPWRYRAEATLIIPQQSGKGLESMLAYSSAMSGSTMSMPTDMSQSLVGRQVNYSDILKSRTLAGMIVDGLSLKKYYRGSDRDSLIALVRSKIKVKEQKGILRIYAQDRNPRMAADLVNYSTIALDEFNKKGNIQFAKRLRVFVGDQLGSAKLELSDSEEKLKKFETQSQMVKISEKEIMLSRLMRDVKVKEAIYTMLMQEYERSRIEEAKEELFFEVLDPAVVPKGPYMPRPLQFSLVALFLGAFMGTFISFFVEYMENLGINVKEPDYRKEVKWATIKKYLTR